MVIVMRAILQRFLYLFNRKENPANVPLENLQLDDVHAWLENIHLDIIRKASLETIALNHFNKLKEFRWVIENKVDKWLAILQSGDGLFGKEEIYLLLVQSRNLIREINLSKDLDIWEIISLNHKLRKNISILLDRISKRN